MSTAVSIRRLHARLRAPASLPDVPARLRRLLAEALDDAIEAALERSGIDAGGELCIRRVDALVRLDLGRPDGLLVPQLALGLAEAIARGAEAEGADVVRYGSRAQALADAALSALAGEHDRAWAWQGLGIWPDDAPVGEAVAVHRVMRVLVAQPTLAAAVLAEVARRGRLWRRLDDAASAAQWAALARAVLAAGGCTAAAGVLDAQAPPPGGAAAPAAAVRRVLGTSAIAAAAFAAQLRARRGAAACRALAALAVAEAEPALLRLPQAALTALVDAVADALHPVWTTDAAAARHVPGGPSLRRDGAGTPAPAHAATAGEADTAACVPSPSAPASLAKVGDAAEADSAAASPPPSGADLPHRHSAAPPPSAAALPLDLRQRAAAVYGGLLFLVPLVGRLDLPARMLEDAALAPRGLRWALHRLALRLIPVAADDAAALAFAGLSPASDPPGADAPAPDPAEDAALDALQGDLLHALRSALGRADDEPARTLIDFVCLRPAEIVADPGWIEVRLALDGVRTEIRAAGLDLDPGWVPWLGRVIVFVYGPRRG